MADAIVSVVGEHLLSIATEAIKNEIQLVRGVDKELLNLSEKLQTIRNVLDDAERKQFKDKAVKDWLRRLEQTSYEMEDVLEEWNYVILQHKIESESVASSPKHKVYSFVPSLCFSIKKLGVRSNVAEKIQDVKLRLDEIMNEGALHRFVISEPKCDPSPGALVQSNSLIDSSVFIGQSHNRDILVTKLTTREEVLGYHIISIVGAGGLGKTALAQLVYNDSRVIECFGDLRIWICVSNTFDVVDIAKGIIKSITKHSPPDTTQLDDLLGKLISCISGEKFLLVLDDVWSEQEDKWEPLRNALQCCGANSKILVTTRKENVAKIMGVADVDILSPELLSEEDCWLLLKQSAHLGVGEREFEKIGKDIAKRCKGLPLAAKTLGSYLRRHKHTVEEWKAVLKSEFWELENEKVNLFPHLLLSYNDLSPALKRCFSFCAYFPKDEIFEVEKLVRTWMALGYLGSNIHVPMELKGYEYFHDLAMRSLFQEFSKGDHNDQITTCKMHDIVHDFAQYLRMSESGGGPRATLRSCKVCNSAIVDQVKEYRCLVWDIDETNTNICVCLASLRVFKYMSYSGGPKGLEKLIHLRWLDMSEMKLSNKLWKTICKLYFLQTLLVRYCKLKHIPREIENLVSLRHLDLSWNEEMIELPESICNLHELQTLLLERCNLGELSSKIGNLVQLRHLNLCFNKELIFLPESICGLVELQTLNIQYCQNLHALPEGIHGLENLRHLLIRRVGAYYEFPQGFSELSSLRTLDIAFIVGSGQNKLGLLKNLNLLNGALRLRIMARTIVDLEELVEDAREAELWNKKHIQALEMMFKDDIDDEEVSPSLWVEVMEALKPSHELEKLSIKIYTGSRLPHWISSPLNKLKEIELYYDYRLQSLPPMGKLPLLETLYMSRLDGIKVVGGEWLGTRGTQGDIPYASSSSTTTLHVVFPKLVSLSFSAFSGWEEWEDITEQDEESAVLRFMPCLTKLSVDGCGRLKVLPDRLLRKAKSLQVLSIVNSPELQRCYQDKDGAPWRSISESNPQLQLVV